VASVFERLKAGFIRRNWSNSAQAWHERAGWLLLLTGAAACYALGNRIGLPMLVLFVALWLAAIVFLWRQDWIRLLGPLFVFDLFQATRRSRYFLLRMYVYFVLLLLVCAVVSWSSRMPLAYRADRGARIAENLFYLFLLAHVVFTALLTPGYVASALTEEKERNTLEALMATDLSSREIVLSKLGVRLANLLLMLFTGLPIVTAFLVVGGVDASLAVVGYLAILFFTATLAALAINNSVRARRTRDAIVTTYIEMGAFLALTSMAFYLIRRGLGTTSFTIRLGPFSMDFWPVVEMVLSGNPLLTMERAVEYVAFGGRSAALLVTLIVEFISFHVTASGILTLLAILRFRRSFQKQTYGRSVEDANRFRGLRPGLGNWPMLWKEVFTEAAASRGWLRRILMGLLIAASFLPAIDIELNRRLYANQPEIVNRAYFSFCTLLGSVVLCILLIRVVVESALTYSRERDQQTLDSLLTCPVSTAAIVGSKWLGCLLSVRKLWLWPLAIWAIGIYQIRLPLSMILALVMFWAVYAGVGALFGQWCSLVCRTGLRAIVLTLVALGITTSGVLMIPLQVFGSQMAAEATPGFRTWLLRGQLATSPPIVLGRMIPNRFGRYLPDEPEAWEWRLTLAGTGVWLAVGIGLWFLLCRRVRVPADRAAGVRLQQKLAPFPANAEKGMLLPCPTE
jgi:ABC-type transport system involved in multi-copper enzyme maturation permease subunit